MFFVGFMPQSALVWLREKFARNNGAWKTIPLARTGAADRARGHRSLRSHPTRRGGRQQRRGPGSCRHHRPHEQHPHPGGRARRLDGSGRCCTSRSAAMRSHPPRRPRGARGPGGTPETARIRCTCPTSAATSACSAATASARRPTSCRRIEHAARSRGRQRQRCRAIRGVAAPKRARAAERPGGRTAAANPGHHRHGARTRSGSCRSATGATPSSTPPTPGTTTSTGTTGTLQCAAVPDRITNAMRPLRSVPLVVEPPIDLDSEREQRRPRGLTPGKASAKRKATQPLQRVRYAARSSQRSRVGCDSPGSVHSVGTQPRSGRLFELDPGGNINNYDGRPTPSRPPDGEGAL